MSTPHAESRNAGLRWHLRQATQPLHDEADRLGGGFNLQDHADYQDFLLAHARALPALEEACLAAGLTALVPDWPERRRSAALAADLAALGLALPAGAPLALPDRRAALGAAYVLEGSRLGNGVLLRQIPRDWPRHYLSHTAPAGGWPAFLAGLGAALPDPADWPAAVEGARIAFDRFIDALRRTQAAEALPHA